MHTLLIFDIFKLPHLNNNKQKIEFHNQLNFKHSL